MPRKLFVLALFLALLSTLLAPAGAAEGDESWDHTVKSNSTVDPVDIAITVFKPATASAAAPVPVILDSHGWGGSRRIEIDETVEDLLDAGMGVVSIDQRGHGESGGVRHVQDPAREAQDIIAVIDYIATHKDMDWVQHNLIPSAGTLVGDPNDPVLGAIGGSYGGGYQTMTALTEIAEKGETRFDALVPEITWYDLPTALAPEGVARTSWITALYAVSKAPENKLPEFIDKAFAYGAATGQWPGREGAFGAAEEAAGIPNMTKIFRSHSPRGFVKKDVRLDVPVLQRQGITDNLFNLNEGLHIFKQALTPAARAKSVFTAYNGGHVLPAVGSTLPLGNAPSGDPCNDEYKGGWSQLRIDFFKAAFDGDRLGPRQELNAQAYNLATDDNTCLRLNQLPAADDSFNVDPAGLEGWGTPVGVGAPQSIQLDLTGPKTIAGIPRLTGDLYNAGADARAFFALSVGTNPADARVIQNNVMPLRQLIPQGGTDPTGFEIELPGIAVELAEGESLFLTISPISDASFGHGSRTPGLMVISDLTVHVPLV